jgi:hypothetical protein
MNLRSVILLIAGLLCVPGPSSAQNFGVLESAETIDQSNFKLLATPILVFGKNRGNDDHHVALGVGYGFTPRFDAEAKVALGKNTTLFGGNGEYWLLRNDPFDLSVIAGGHFQNNDAPLDVLGVDATLLASKHVARKLEAYGAIALAINRFIEDLPDRSFTQAHLVPGIEYALSDELDVVAELGLGLTDSSRHYFGAGVAYYIR